MGTRGRKSAAELSVINARTVQRIEPRAGAPAEVRGIFEEIVSGVAPEHFRTSDTDLVEQYAQAIALAREAYEAVAKEGPVVNGKANPWIVVLEKAHRSAVALAGKLRLCPQTRADAREAGKTTRPPVRKLWE